MSVKLKAKETVHKYSTLVDKVGFPPAYGLTVLNLKYIGIEQLVNGRKWWESVFSLLEWR